MMAIAIAPVMFLFPNFPDPINASNFQRIADGMTEQQVERILGRSGDSWWQADLCAFGKTWYGQNGNAIALSFRVVNRQCVVCGREYWAPTLADRVIAWCGGFALPGPIVGRPKPAPTNVAG